MTVTPRRTVRVPDDEWNAGHAKAQAEGKTLTDVLRRLLSGYLAGYRTEYQVTSKTAVGGTQQVIRGIAGSVEEVKRLYPPTRWTIEEYDVSPTRPVRKKRDPK